VLISRAPSFTTRNFCPANWMRAFYLSLTLCSLAVLLFLTPRPSSAAPFNLKVDFVPTGMAPYTGYVADTGQAFGERGNGFSYGWIGVSPTMSLRSNSQITDPRGTGEKKDLYLSQAAFTTGGWKVAVPNGQYRIRAAVGDPEQLSVFSSGACTGYCSGFSVKYNNDKGGSEGYSVSQAAWQENTSLLLVTNGEISITTTGEGRLSFVEITQIAPLSINLDFEPSSGVNGGRRPTTVPGFISDTSRAYGTVLRQIESDRVYYELGWSVADSSSAINRVPDSLVANVAPYDSSLYKSVIQVNDRVWEIAIPSGNYKVRVVAGDASGTNLGLTECAVEGRLFFSKILTVDTAENHFADATDSVVVTDGRLSISRPVGSTAKLDLCFVEITGSSPAEDAFAPSPGTPRPTDRSASWVGMIQAAARGAGSGSAGGPSSANSVNMASGVYSHDHGTDLSVRNPVGPSVSFGISYRSATARNGVRGNSGTAAYSSPGFPAGWTHNYDVHIETVSSSLLRMYTANGLGEDLAVDAAGAISPQSGAPFAVIGVPSDTAGQWTSITVIPRRRISLGVYPFHEQHLSADAHREHAGAVRTTDLRYLGTAGFGR
jgi:hypothetical protein